MKHHGNYTLPEPYELVGGTEAYLCNVFNSYRQKHRNAKRHVEKVKERNVRHKFYVYNGCSMNRLRYHRRLRFCDFGSEDWCYR